LRRFVTLMLASLLGTGCASSYPVTRMVGGHRVQGRFVGDQAYAAYLKGVVLETQGRFDAAAAAYEEAIVHDPDSAELWTRIGALRCSASARPGAPTSENGPWDAFTRAAEIDPEYEETWTERARCHLRRGQLEQAASAARVATSLDPDRLEPPLLLAQILERQGRIAEARQWLDGLVVREPTSTEAHEAMAGFASRTHDDARREASLRALSVLRPPRLEDKPFQRVRPSLAEIDSALSSRDFDRAESLALSARVSSGALALRAAALGIVGFARAHAELVLSADPSDSDARVAAAVAADIARDDDALTAIVSALPDSSTPLSPLASALMAELLDRRLGPSVRQTWLRNAGTKPAEGDPLLAAVMARR
jgi:tetratricopeptide (TPR) repeat protein